MESSFDTTYKGQNVEVTYEWENGCKGAWEKGGLQLEPDEPGYSIVVKVVQETIFDGHTNWVEIDINEDNEAKKYFDRELEKHLEREKDESRY